MTFLAVLRMNMYYKVHLGSLNFILHLNQIVTFVDILARFSQTSFYCKYVYMYVYICANVKPAFIEDHI